MTTNPSNTNPTIYSYLDSIRTRPLMYLHDKDNLDELELLVFGYYAALQTHNIDENVPPLNSHFLDWVRHHKNWSMSQGWAKAIHSNLPKDLSAFDVFFALIDEYRQLKPKRCAWVLIDPVHHSVNPGLYFNKVKVLPNRIFIVQYNPEHLYFLEFEFASEPKSQNGFLVNSLEKAIEWTYKEFRITSNEWIWL